MFFVDNHPIFVHEHTMYPFFQCHNILNKIQKEKRKIKRMNNKFLVAIRIWKCSQPNIFESLKWFCHATKYGNPQKAAGGLLVWQFYCPLYSIFWYTLYICCRVLACWAIVWLQISWTLIFGPGTKTTDFSGLISGNNERWKWKQK